MVKQKQTTVMWISITPMIISKEITILEKKRIQDMIFQMKTGGKDFLLPEPVLLQSVHRHLKKPDLFIVLLPREDRDQDLPGLFWNGIPDH